MIRNSFVVMVGIFLLLVNSSCQDQETIRRRQIFTSGLMLYQKLCQNCHGEDGKGLGKLIPPLAGADYMYADKARTVCIIRNGLQGEIMVNSIKYNNQMPANQNLTSIEIAQLMTFIYNSWGKKDSVFTQKNMEKIISNCDK
ncbi:MAG: cytochrome c [Verrucomicrobia bacterium]|nr:cytochrome c [Cytophagales bacterium]